MSNYDTVLPVGSISGTQAVLHNLKVAVSLADQIRSTYGPRGRDKLIYDSESGEITISNDGATVLKLLKPEQPIAQLLVNLSVSQDVEIGDGTTGVVLFTAHLCERACELVNRGFHTHIIIRGYKMACDFVLQEMNKLERSFEVDSMNANSSVLKRVIQVPLNSKVLTYDKEFFSQMIIGAMDAILQSGQSFDMDSISILSVPGGSLTDSYMVDGLVFERTFTYAGYEQQRKRISSPKILLLDQEIELKHQKEYAHVVIDQVTNYDKFVNTEWQIVQRKLDQICDTGCNLILDSRGIGDLATQYFVQRNITNISRIDYHTMTMIANSVNATILSTLEDLPKESDSTAKQVYGSCAQFEEMTIGDEQYCVLSGTPQKKHYTLILRASSEEIIQEAHRSLHDAICCLCNALKYPAYLYGGGATEMALKTRLIDHCSELEKEVTTQTANDFVQASILYHQSQIAECMRSFGDSLEDLVVTLARNCNVDSADIISDLNHIHHQRKHTDNIDRFGINIDTGRVDSMETLQLYEPSVVKKHAIKVATEAACMILSIDHVVKMPNAENLAQGR